MGRMRVFLLVILASAFAAHAAVSEFGSDGGSVDEEAAPYEAAYGDASDWIDGDLLDPIDGIVDITPDNYDRLIHGRKLAIIEFYTPRCQQCSVLLPQLMELGEIILADARIKKRVLIGRVDASQYPSIADKFNVETYPTFKVVAAGIQLDPAACESLPGPFTAHKIFEYVQTQLEDGPFVASLDNVAEQWMAGDANGLLKVAINLVDKLEGEDKERSGLYIQAMAQSMAKGKGHLLAEKKRLEKYMASTRAMSAKKFRDHVRRCLVLASFLPPSKY